MNKSKLIIVEGPQGVGKTTYTDFLRHTVPYTNLLRLSGTSDDSIETGKAATSSMYFAWADLVDSLANHSINLLFDRYFFSEENYCRLGKKKYTFSEVYYELVNRLNVANYDIYFVLLQLKNTDLFEQRLFRDSKGTPEYAKYSANASIEQQNMYIEMAKELKEIAPNIHVIYQSTDAPIEKVKNELLVNLKIKPQK